MVHTQHVQQADGARHGRRADPQRRVLRVHRHRQQVPDLHAGVQIRHVPHRAAHARHRRRPEGRRQVRMARTQVHRTRRLAPLLDPQRSLHRVPQPIVRVQQRGVLPDDQARDHPVHRRHTDRVLRQAVQRTGESGAGRVARRRSRRYGD